MIYKIAERPGFVCSAIYPRDLTETTFGGGPVDIPGSRLSFTSSAVDVAQTRRVNTGFQHSIGHLSFVTA